MTPLLFALWSVSAWADALEGWIVGVADGDTITLLDNNRQQHKIRLAGIDAPEKAQPFGQRSKQHLAELAFGKDAKADCYKVDRYDRDVVNGPIPLRRRGTQTGSTARVFSPQRMHAFPDLPSSLREGGCSKSHCCPSIP